MSRLTDFYKGIGTDDRGRGLADLWAFSDRQLEEIHDFIQWMFPLREVSQFNPSAPVLTDADLHEFRADRALQENLLRSYQVFLAFLGLRLKESRVEPGADFDEKKDVFAYPNHNWLRITRVLTSTQILGLKAESRAFFEFLKNYRESGRSGITSDTFRYWENAVDSA
jgi:hypothetical protein